jgi:hypothetical protein
MMLVQMVFDARLSDRESVRQKAVMKRVEQKKSRRAFGLPGMTNALSRLLRR